MTGASGLLGSELTRLLSQNGHEVIAGYNTHPPSIGEPLRIDLADLNQIEPTVRKARPDTIIHTAATTDVDLCEKDPALAEIVNGKATGKIAEAGNALQSPIIYLSTDYVFEGERGNYREDERATPRQSVWANEASGGAAAERERSPLSDCAIERCLWLGEKVQAELRYLGS